MKGLRTFVVSFLLAVAPAATTYFGNVNWVQLLRDLGVPAEWSVPAATLLAGAIMAYMRSITSTSPGQKP